LGRNPHLGGEPPHGNVPLDFSMDKPFIYEIRVEGHLTDRWSDWFEELAIRNEPGGETVLSGPLIDQSALFGVLNKIHALHLVLVSVARKAA
jgi:hypothetical protein